MLRGLMVLTSILHWNWMHWRIGNKLAKAYMVRHPEWTK